MRIRARTIIVSLKYDGPPAGPERETREANREVANLGSSSHPARQGREGPGEWSGALEGREVSIQSLPARHYTMNDSHTSTLPGRAVNASSDAFDNGPESEPEFVELWWNTYRTEHVPIEQLGPLYVCADRGLSVIGPESSPLEEMLRITDTTVDALLEMRIRQRALEWLELRAGARVRLEVEQLPGHNGERADHVTVSVRLEDRAGWLEVVDVGKA